jgi:hypothetical protein
MARFLILLVLLAGCGERASARLERQYAMMEKAGASKSELCTKARAVAEAYLAEEDTGQYAQKKLAADIDCNSADIERLRR